MEKERLTQSNIQGLCYLVLELKGKELIASGNSLQIYSDFKQAKLAFTKAIIWNVGKNKTLLLVSCVSSGYLTFKLKETCLSYILPVDFKLPAEVDMYDYTLDTLIDGLR